MEAGYQRSGPLVILLLSVLEVVIQKLREGRQIEEALDQALDMKNWRQIEPLPPEIRPLVRKVQRSLPVALVRKMLVELFWFLTIPQLVEGGLIALVSDAD